MEAGNLVRIDVGVWQGYVERYFPDLSLTNTNSQPLNRSQKRELKKAIDSALTSLDDVFSQVV